MGLADPNVMRERAIELPPAAALATVTERLEALARETEDALRRQGVGSGSLQVHRRVHVRYEGTDSALVVPFGSVAEIQAAFEAAYRQRFAFLMKERGLVIEAVSMEAVGASDAPNEKRHASSGPAAAPVADTVRLFSGGRWWDAALVVREQTRPGHLIDGPAIIAEKNATTVVEPDWRARVTELDHRVLERVQPREARKAIGTQVDPVMLEVFNNLFMNIAEQMGLQLQNTAYSVNIKERLDFSCALRRRRQADRQRAAHAGAPGLDERIDQDGDRTQRRAHAPGRRLRAQRPVPRRHPSARRDDGDPGIQR